MKKYLFILISLSLTFITYGRTWRADEIPQPRMYDAQNWVANPDNILSPATVASINSMLNDINNKTNAQVAVAIVDDMDAGNIDDFATDLFKAWGVGEKGANNGVLLVVAVGARQYAFRTGRGIGGVLTDVQTARIGRNSLVPNFKASDYDRGVMSAVEEIHSALTSPEAIEEIRNDSAKAANGDDDISLAELFTFYLWFCLGLTAVLFVWLLVKIHRTSKLERHTRYMRMRPMLRIMYGLCFVGLGIPLLVYLPARYYLRNLRDGVHNCPNCGTKMHKLDEVHDNEHLTPAQDVEERIDSVDYDVWECPNCGEEDIYAFENEDSAYVECPFCHARTAHYLRDRIVKTPTTKAEGLAVKEFECVNCRKLSQIPYKLPRLENAAKAALPFIILGGLGRGGGDGGGFGGGSFGGGFTGGGGSSGSW